MKFNTATFKAARSVYVSLAALLSCRLGKEGKYG
jgi:hypothetical protein